MNTISLIKPSYSVVSNVYTTHIHIENKSLIQRGVVEAVIPLLWFQELQEGPTTQTGDFKTSDSPQHIQLIVWHIKQMWLTWSPFTPGSPAIPVSPCQQYNIFNTLRLLKACYFDTDNADLLFLPDFPLVPLGQLVPEQTHWYGIKCSIIQHQDVLKCKQKKRICLTWSPLSPVWPLIPFWPAAPFLPFSPYKEKAYKILDFWP